MQRFLILAVHGFRRIIANKGLSEPKAMLEEKHLYEMKNNPVVLFAADHSIIGQPVKDTYLCYATWCRENGCQPLSSIEMGKELSRKCNIESTVVWVDGKSIRIYKQKQITKPNK